jgi:hypothetical protein
MGTAMAAAKSPLRNFERKDMTIPPEVGMQSMIALIFRATRNVWAYVYKHKTGEFVAAKV